MLHTCSALQELDHAVNTSLSAAVVLLLLLLITAAIIACAAGCKRAQC
jgi:hypothetical protein